MFEKKWVLANKELGEPVSEVTADREERYFEKILSVIAPPDRDSFLNPTIDKLSNPYKLPDIEPCLSRIMDAVDNGEHIAIFGDYDCDGVTATAIMYDFLKNQLSADVEYVLPDRMDEGYGLTKSAVDTAAEYGTTLIITVDNGVSAKDEIAYAATKGIDVIVTDHHDLPPELPACAAIVNPMREDSVYPTKYLCGAGVAFKVVCALSLELGLDDFLKYIPFAALGTVADVVPLLGENRIIVKNGLEMMKESEFAGVRTLFKNALTSENEQPTAETISFGIAPKLNAAGRVDKADVACELLLAGTDYEADGLYQELLKLNDKRKALEDGITAECRPGSLYMISGPGSRMIVAEKDDWHPGVLGLAASKLTNEYALPVVVLSKEKDLPDGTKLLRASARSTDNVNLTDLLESVRDILVKYGGHGKAAGFSITDDKLPEFISRAEKYLKESTPKKVVTETAMMYLPPDLVTLSMAKRLKSLEPYGEGNRSPVFFTDGIERVSASVFKDGKHLRATVSFNNGRNVQAFAFNYGRYAGMLSGAFKGGVLYTFDINNYRGEELQLRLLDFTECYSDYAFDPQDTYRLSREGLGALYGQVRHLGREFTFSRLGELKNAIQSDRNVSPETKNMFTWFKIRYGLAVFAELGYIINTQKGCYEFAENTPNRKLEESSLYAELA